MRMHIGRNVAAFGLAALVVSGVAGTALAASGSSSPAQQATATVTASASAQSAGSAKITTAQLAAKLGVSQKQLLAAIGDFKDIVASSGGKWTKSELYSALVKTLAVDLRITVSPAEWAATEILGGHVSN